MANIYRQIPGSFWFCTKKVIKYPCGNIPEKSMKISVKRNER